MIGRAAGLMAILWASSAVATIVTYTNEASWQAAVTNSFVNEPFNSTGLQPFTSVVFSSGGLIGSARGVLSGSVWTDHVTSAGGESTTFAYTPGALRGAGATWDTSPSSEGQGLALSLTLVMPGGTQTIGQIGPIDGSFFGWTSDVPFTSFTIAAGSHGGIAETYDMDNLHLAAVPEPSSSILLCLGGSGLFVYFRRKRAA